MSSVGQAERVSQKRLIALRYGVAVKVAGARGVGLLRSKLPTAADYSVRSFVSST